VALDAFGVRFVVAPEGTVAVLAALLGGVALGTASGLVPGLHVNNLALLLAAAMPALPGPPHLVGAAVLAAGVVHSFLDVVPALAVGVPDAAMAVSALPGHRLVLAGRGREAIRLSALGSAGAVLCAVPLAVPLTAGMGSVYPLLRSHLGLVLGGVALFLVVTERAWLARVGGVLALALSGALGVLTLDYEPTALLGAGDMLVPLFAGLFGAPILIEAMGGEGVPEQGDPGVLVEPHRVAAAGVAGALAGAVVGYVPGVSSAVAATVALAALPRSGDRGFVVATSGVNTANTVFALFALVALGTPRTGVMVALETANAPLNLPLLLLAVVVGAAAGVTLLLVVGDRYLRVVGAIDATRLSAGVLGLLAVLATVFAGPVGLATFAVASAVGLVPARLGARRVHLMGVLMVPLTV
jgi:putative membrane protein